MEIAGFIITTFAAAFGVYAYFKPKKSKKDKDKSNDKLLLPVFDYVGCNVDFKWIIIVLKVHENNMVVERIDLKENDFCWLFDRQQIGYYDRNKGLPLSVQLLHKLGESAKRESLDNKQIHFDLYFRDKQENRIKKSFHLVNNKLEQENVVYLD